MIIRHALWGAAFVVATSAAAHAETPRQTDFWTCPSTFQGQTLHIYNWTTYIAEDTIANFERLCGVSIQYDTYGSDDEALEALRVGDSGYDLIVPTDGTVYDLIAEDLLQPIDLRSIPNTANLAARFRDLPHDPDNRYTIPYQWGTIGIGYNRTTLGEEITSWQQVFDSGARVAWLDEDRAMFGFALTVLGLDPNTSDAADLTAARQYLIDHAASVTEAAPDTGQDLLAAGAADIVIEYSGDIFQVIADCACDDYAYTIPDEGALLWIDSLAIPNGAPNKRLAETFIDYLLVPQVSADIGNYTAYASPNQAAIDAGLVESRYLDNPAIYPDEALLARLFLIVSNPELGERYATEWQLVKDAAGL